MGNYFKKMPHTKLYLFLKKYGYILEDTKSILRPLLVKIRRLFNIIDTWVRKHVYKSIFLSWSIYEWLCRNGFKWLLDYLKIVLDIFV